jgi:hypothetical protein
VCIYYTSTWELGKRIEFEASLGYGVRSSLKINNNNKKKKTWIIQDDIISRSLI